MRYTPAGKWPRDNDAQPELSEMLCSDNLFPDTE